MKYSLVELFSINSFKIGALTPSVSHCALVPGWPPGGVLMSLLLVTIRSTVHCHGHTDLLIDHGIVGLYSLALLSDHAHPSSFHQRHFLVTCFHILLSLESSDHQ